MKPKTVTRPGGYIGGVVASGEAEIAVQQIVELLAVPGIDLVGPLPDEIQKVFETAAGIFTASRQPAAAEELLRFLLAPANAGVFEEVGLEQAGADSVRYCGQTGGSDTAARYGVYGSASSAPFHLSRSVTPLLDGHPRPRRIRDHLALFVHELRVQVGERASLPQKAAGGGHPAGTHGLEVLDLHLDRRAGADLFSAAGAPWRCRARRR